VKMRVCVYAYKRVNHPNQEGGGIVISREAEQQKAFCTKGTLACLSWSTKYWLMGDVSVFSGGVQQRRETF
jgi:hypothetical protein